MEPPPQWVSAGLHVASTSPPHEGIHFVVYICGTAAERVGKRQAHVHISLHGGTYQAVLQQQAHSICLENHALWQHSTCTGSSSTHRGTALVNK